MVHARPLSALCGLLALCLFVVPRANADTVTKSGMLSNDNSVVDFSISTTTTQTYTFFTTSYAGGTNADGTTTMAGGFDPVLTLFTAPAPGTFVPNAVGGGSNSCTGVNADPGTGSCEDAFFTRTLAPGNYILALSEFPNYSNGTLNDFNPDNASAIAGSCSTSTPFVDANTCSQRTADYTVNYTSAAVSTVTPEPPSALLVFLPLAGIVVLNRRRLASLASL